MQSLNLVLELLCIALTLVEAYTAQLHGYGPPRSEPFRSPRPAWTPQASYFPRGQHSPPYTPPRISAPRPVPRPHYYYRPPIPHYPPAPYTPQALPRPVAYPHNLPPASPVAPQQHIYWYRPGPPRLPIPSNRLPSVSSAVHAVPRPVLGWPVGVSSPGFLRPPPYPNSALPTGSYGQQPNTAKHSQTRVFTSPMQRNRRRISVVRIPSEDSAALDGTNNDVGDEFPREELTTPPPDFDVNESQANVSSRRPRKVFHSEYEDNDETEPAQDGTCGQDTSCRTSYHCALLGGRPTFIPCSYVPRLYCCDLSVQNTIDSSSNSTVKSDPQCGWNREKTSRVIGGHETEFGEIPWQAFVKVEGFRCGGALLSRTHIVTAAHCVVGKKESRIEVLLGELVLKRMVEELPHERRHVSKVIIHPKYENLNVDSYDVAILVLDRPVDYQANIVPICLPEPDESFTGVLATVSGWGRVFADHEIRSNHLQSVQVPIIGNRLCRNWLRSRRKYAGINADHVCAGYEEGGRDSCRGDSGGPLTYQKNGRWYLVGIVSAGFSCGKPRQPGIYHRVSHSVKWISENVFS